MSAESPTLPSIAGSPWSDAIRLYRRLCVLRAQGEDEVAARMETEEFMPLAENIRSGGDGGSLDPLLAAEAARVADAAVLAELLAPLLARRLAATWGEAPKPGIAADGPAPRINAKFVQPGTTPTVADLIDGMLAQDRAAPRTR